MTSATTVTADGWEAKTHGWTIEGATIFFVPNNPTGRYLWLLHSYGDHGTCDTLTAAKAFVEACLAGKS